MDTVFIEIVGGCEGDSISISDMNGSGRRVCGPKPWGGGRVKRRWEVEVKDILIAVEQARPDEIRCAELHNASKLYEEQLGPVPTLEIEGGE